MASEKPTAQRVIHIIDDDQALRESLAFLLRTAKLEVKSFELGQSISRHIAGRVLGLRHNRRANAGYQRNRPLETFEGT